MAPSTFTYAVESGRKKLLMFVVSGGNSVPVIDLTPEARVLAFTTNPVSGRKLFQRLLERTWRGLAIGLLLPLAILLGQALLSDPVHRPGFLTWQWTFHLGLINSVFLVAGPFLWNSLITAASEIDGATNSVGRNKLADWINGKYKGCRSLTWQVIWAVGGGLVGIGVLLTIHILSDQSFEIGPSEYFSMFETAALATNGFWILWWVPGLIPELDQIKLELMWHDPARTPVIVFLNRALWKGGFAISVGIAFLSVAVSGLPANVLAESNAGYQWSLVVYVQYVAFAVLTAVFVRLSFWGQWRIFSLVRRYINKMRLRIDTPMDGFSTTFSNESSSDAKKVAYLSQMDRHFDSLQAVDLKLGWAVTWGSSILAAGISVVVAVYQATPN